MLHSVMRPNLAPLSLLLATCNSISQCCHSFVAHMHACDAGDLQGTWNGHCIQYASYNSTTNQASCIPYQ